jgi:hypothetical protein
VTTNWADYPQIGTTSNAVVISANLFNWSGAFQSARLYFISKAQLYNTSCGGGTATTYTGITNSSGNLAFTVQPALSYVSSTTGYGINSLTSGAGFSLTKWNYTTSSASPPAVTLTRTTIPVASWELAPAAVQKGSTTALNTGDARFLNAVYQPGALWTTHTIRCQFSGDTTIRACIRYYKINPVTNVVDKIATYGAVGSYYFYPAITANAAGDATIVFNRSSSTEFAGSRYTGRRSTDAGSSLQGSASLAAGQGCYVKLDTSVPPRNRWGDYSGVALNPANTLQTWIFSEYAVGTSTTCTNNVWGTRFGKISWPTVTSTLSAP